MKIIRNSILLSIIIFFVFSSCSILDQAGEIKAFTRCEFRLVDVQDIILAGIDVQEIYSISDLSFTEASKLSMAAMQGELPLDFTLNLEVRNPNEQNASLSGLYWILLIDDIQITDGRVGEKVSVPPNGGVATMPVDIQVDLFEALSGESADAIINFGLNMAGNGGYPSRVKLKIKPTIHIAMTKMNYPGYFTIEEEFVSQ